MWHTVCWEVRAQMGSGRLSGMMPGVREDRECKPVSEERHATYAHAWLRTSLMPLPDLAGRQPGDGGAAEALVVVPRSTANAKVAQCAESAVASRVLPPFPPTR